MPGLKRWSEVDRELTPGEVGQARAALARAGLQIVVAQNARKAELVDAVKQAFRQRRRRAVLKAKGL